MTSDKPATRAPRQETGWWDEHGTPAPFPPDFFQPDGTISPDWQPTTNNDAPSDPPY